ncbi:MAG: hypothetical protein ACYCWE_02980 [Eubacteriales bacterium]
MERDPQEHYGVLFTPLRYAQDDKTGGCIAQDGHYGGMTVRPRWQGARDPSLQDDRTGECSCQEDRTRRA